MFENGSTDHLVSVNRAAEVLALSPATLRAWMAARRIEFVRLGRAVRIPTAEIKRLQRDGTVRVGAR